MNESDDLLDLIRSLSKSEKRYFKLYASTHKNESRAVRLFDALEKKGRYDVKGNDPVFKKQTLPVIKNHLYKLILKSMYAYHAQASVEIKLRESIAYADFLSQKGLLSQSGKIINKAKLLAEKYDYRLALMELIEKSAILNSQQWLRKITDEDIESNYREMEDSIEQWKILNESRHVAGKLFLTITRLGYGKNNESIKYEKDVEKMLLILKEKKDLSFHAKYVICNTCSNWYLNFKRYAEAYSSMLHITSFFENNIHYIENFPRIYLITMVSKMNCENALKKYEDMEQSIKSLDIDRKSVV